MHLKISVQPVTALPSPGNLNETSEAFISQHHYQNEKPFTQNDSTKQPSSAK